MKIQFNTIYEFAEFAELICEKLYECGNTSEADEFKHFTYLAYTSTTEYLGDYRESLLELKKKRLPSGFRKQIKYAIKSIEKLCGFTFI